MSNETFNDLESSAKVFMLLRILKQLNENSEFIFNEVIKDIFLMPQIFEIFNAYMNHDKDV